MSSGLSALFGFKFRKNLAMLKHSHKTDHQGISSLKQDGKLITDPIPKANVMNDQFKSVFSNVDKINELEFFLGVKISSFFHFLIKSIELSF
jgi:hypothetical protein